ncbi:MAG: hypothetical protein ABIR84_00385 [Candidatus Nitrotoga sp.]
MKTNILRLSTVLASVMALSACTTFPTFPTGPGMLVLPGTGKNIDQFRLDEADCRQYATVQIGGKTANETAANNEDSVINLQMRYDFAYQQCMYAKGHRIPVMGRMDYSQKPDRNLKDVSSTTPGSSSSSNDDFTPPPPPSGTPPPPPSDD